MPTQQQHVSKAENNAAFAKALDLKDRTCIEWAMTSLFYSGMHYVEAYLVKNGSATTTHKARDKYFAFDSNLKKIANEYWDLKQFGYSARYEVPNFKAVDVTNDAIPALETIKAHIQVLL